MEIFQKSPSSSRVYSIFSSLTNNNVLVKLAIRHLKNREIQEFLLVDLMSLVRFNEFLYCLFYS